MNEVDEIEEVYEFDKVYDCSSRVKIMEVEQKIIDIFKDHASLKKIFICRTTREVGDEVDEVHEVDEFDEFNKVYAVDDADNADDVDEVDEINEVDEDR